MKIKLRDLTEEQFRRYCELTQCNGCNSCIFNNVVCANNERVWMRHKDLYSDKFLNKEIDIPSLKPLLTDKERKYLNEILKPIHCKINYMQKITNIHNNTYLIISFDAGGYVAILLPLNHLKDMPFKGLTNDYKYKLEELGL